MGKALVAGAVVVILAILLTWIVSKAMKKDPKGDLNLEQESELRQLLYEAAFVFRGLGYTEDIEEIEIISTSSKARIDKWLKDYESLRIKIRKEIDA